MINERTRQVENIEKMIHLQNKLDFTKSSEASKTSFCLSFECVLFLLDYLFVVFKKHFELITPKRIFLRDGSFRVSTQKRTLSEAQVFLFSDLIVITKRNKRAETFLVLNKIPLDSVIVRTQKELLNQKGGCTLCVLLALAPYQHTYP